MAFKTFTNGEVLDEDDLNDYLMKQANIVCTSGSRPSSPVDGMEIYETDTKLKRRYFTAQGAWVIWPPQVVEAVETTSVSTTSASYGVGSPVCDTTFAGPPSGKALITVSGNLEGFGTDGGIYLAYQIRETNAAGSIFFDADDYSALQNQGTGNIQASFTRYHSGFTPGQVYYIRTMHRSGTGGSSVTAFYRRLTIVPLPN